MNLPTCKTSDRKTTRAFTLMELLVATGIAAMVVLALVGMMMFGGKTFAGIFSCADMDDSNRIAMGTLTRDIRTAQRLVSFSTHDFTLRDDAGANLTYRYDPGNQTL